MNARISRIVVAATLASVAACSDATSTAPVPIVTPARALVRTGDGQQITVASAASDPLSITVFSTDGTPVQGTIVRWAVVAGVGTLRVDSSLTDASGIATNAFVAGTTAGLDQVTATVASLDPVVFTEIALPDAAAQLTATIAPEDSVMEGATLTGLGVRLVDKYGNGIPNATITFALAQQQDGDQLGALAVVTDANGIAVDSFTAGTVVGQRTVMVATDSNLTFTYLLDVLAPQTE